MSEPIFRHEYKYLVAAAQLKILQPRMEALLQKDAHVSKKGVRAGMYSVRSIYFDDFQQTAYKESESGTDPREKFRIRIYNHRDDYISLELKFKRSGKCLKQSCPLTREQCELLIQGKCLPESREYPPLLQKLLLQIRLRDLRPAVIVEYDRAPYVYPIGNVRVTMDCNIRTSRQYERFFEKDLLMRPVLPTGQHILEIKWDVILPDHVRRAVMLENLQWSSFSKFYWCQRFCLST